MSKNSKAKGFGKSSGKKQVFNIDYASIGIDPNATSDKLPEIKEIIFKLGDMDKVVDEIVSRNLLNIRRENDETKESFKERQSQLARTIAFACKAGIIMQKKAKLSGEGKKSKLAKRADSAKLKAETVLPKVVFDGIYRSNNFVSINSEEGLAILYSSKLETVSKLIEIDTCLNLEYDIAISESEFRDSIPYDSIEYNDQVVRRYKDHYGFYPNGRPIVTKPVKKLYELLSSRIKKDADLKDLETIESLLDPVERHHSNCIRFLSNADQDVYRDIFNDVSYVTPEYRTNYMVIQETVFKEIAAEHQELAYIEVQPNKTGPRVRSSSQDEKLDPAFWEQIVALFEDTEVTEKGIRMFRNGCKDFFDDFKLRIGCIDLIPLFGVVTDVEELKNLRSLIYNENASVQLLGKEIWEHYLKTSSRVVCVYSHLKKNTSKGAPYFTSKITNLEWLDIIIHWFECFYHPELALNLTPFTLVERVQNSTPDESDPTKLSKVRHRVAQCLSVLNAWTMCFTVPWMAALKLLEEGTSFISHEQVGVVIKEKVDTLFRNGEAFKMVSTDISAYDSHLDGVMKMSWNRDELSSKFENNLGESFWSLFGSTLFSEDLSQDQIQSMMMNQRHYYLRAPLCIPGGFLIGNHGLPSGTPATALFGTLWNIICNRGLAKENGIEVILSMFQGDDAILCYKGDHFSLDDLCVNLKEFGHNAGNDKNKQAFMDSSVEFPYFYFVGKYFFLGDKSYSYKPVYLVSSMFARLLWPEDTKVSPSESAIRAANGDYNSTYFVADKAWKDKREDPSLVDPSLEMAVRVTQSLMNICNHPLHEKVVEEMVNLKPGVFLPLLLDKMGDSLDYWKVLQNEGTLLGTEKEIFNLRFAKHETVQLILRTLKSKYEQFPITFDLYPNGRVNLSTLVNESKEKAKEKASSQNYNPSNYNEEELDEELETLIYSETIPSSVANYLLNL